MRKLGVVALWGVCSLQSACVSKQESGAEGQSAGNPPAQSATPSPAAGAGATKPASAAGRPRAAAEPSAAPPAATPVPASAAPSPTSSDQKADLAGARTWEGIVELSPTDVAYAPTWHKNIVSSALAAAFLDASGNIYAGGAHTSNLLLKFSPELTLAWEKPAASVPRAGLSRRVDLRGGAWALHPSGEMYSTGAVGLDVSLVEGQPSAGHDDIFVVKYSKEGEPAWVRQVGSPSADSGTRIAVSQDGVVYIAANTGGQLPQQPPEVAGRPCVIKYDASGQRVWIRPLPDRRDYGLETSDLAVDGNDNVYLSQSAANGRGGLKKLGPDGTIVWEYRVDPPPNQQQVVPSLDHLAIHPDGKTIYSFRSGNDYAYSTGVAAFSSEGRLLWFRKLGTETKVIDPVEGVKWIGSFVPSRNVVFRATKDALYVGGEYFNSFVNGSVRRENFRAGFVARYDLSGELVWFQQFVVPQRLIGEKYGPRQLYISGVELNANGELVVIGGTGVPVEFPRRPGRYQAKAGIFLIRLAAADGRRI